MILVNFEEVGLVVSAIVIHDDMIIITIFLFLDTTYFSAGFYESDSSSSNIGREFNVTFHDVTYDGENLSITERFSAKNDVMWLNCKFPDSSC